MCFTAIKECYRLSNLCQEGYVSCGSGAGKSNVPRLQQIWHPMRSCVYTALCLLLTFPWRRQKVIKRECIPESPLPKRQTACWEKSLIPYPMHPITLNVNSNMIFKGDKQQKQQQFPMIYLWAGRVLWHWARIHTVFWHWELNNLLTFWVHLWKVLATPIF